LTKSADYNQVFCKKPGFWDSPMKETGFLTKSADYSQVFHKKPGFWDSPYFLLKKLPSNWPGSFSPNGTTFPSFLTLL
jgi:hypothetical protein